MTLDGEFSVQLVGDIAANTRNALVGGPFGSYLVSRDYVDFGVPVIRGQNLGLGRWVSGEYAYVSQEKAASLSANLARPGDIVFTQRGTLGQVALVPAGPYDEYVVSQSQMKLTVDVNKADPMFVYYVFQTDQMQDYVRNHAITTGVPHTNLGILRQTPIPLPSLPEQRAIAHILGTLDDKIDLNRQMNQTLEQIAATLFKSWFVDFDPVRAKAEGRQPEGMDADTAALFPDRLVESKLGEIPEGWDVGPILNHARLLSGGTPKTNLSEYWGGAIRWASAKDVSQSNETFLIETERTITDLGVQNSATQIIPAFCTVVVARGATTGRMVLLGREMAMNQTCYALATTTDTPFALFCKLRYEMDKLVHAAHGSVFDTITTNTFARSIVILPPQAILHRFEATIESVFHRMLASTEETQTLAALRDTLLPRLLSGELRVPTDLLDKDPIAMPQPTDQPLVQSTF